jgi:hypothetical protein
MGGKLMIRIRYIIPKEDIFNWVENSNIVKIQLKNHRNMKLKDDKSCEIFAFYKIDFNSIPTIIGLCERIVNENRRYDFLNGVDLSFLTGIQSQKRDGYLSKSMIVKLIEIEKKYNVNLSITKEIKNIINIIL